MSGRARVLVVGGGIAGLAAALEATAVATGAAAGACDVVLAEAAARCGGKLTTRVVEGFVLEGGPDSLPPGRPDAVRLAADLGVDLLPSTDPAPPGVLLRRRLRAVPEGMGGFLPRRLGPLARTRLFSPAGKLRMACEVLVPARRDGEDETLERFVRRRLGGQAYRRLVEPVASGLFCGDPARLSVMATMGHLRAAEASHGSLIRAVWSGRSRPPAAPSVPRAPARGMAALAEAAASRLTALGGAVLTSTRVTRLVPDGDGYRVQLNAHGETGEEWFDAVVVAVPAPQAAALLTETTPAAAAALGGVPQSSVTVVGLGWAGRPDTTLGWGTGYLVPAGGGPVRAVSLTSARFPGRAPDAGLTLRVTLGEALEDDDALAAVSRHLRGRGVTQAPTVTAVQRWAGAIPQYTLGHRERVTAVAAALGGPTGGTLVVAGSALDGLGIADCVASGTAAARRVMAALAAR